MKLAEIGEFGLIGRLRKAVGENRDVVLGIGDDCAVTEVPAGHRLLTTTDLLIEGIHFRRDWTDLRQLGRKSVSVNVSDLAAMGGTPRHLSLGLGLPPDLTVEDFDHFMNGFLAAAADYQAALIGGDLSRSPGPLVIAVTAQGVVDNSRHVPRSGARPGDAVYLSGTLGDSALALHLLQKGEQPDPSLVRRLHDPEAKVALGEALAAKGLPSAMIDISDGLLADLGHILESSNAGAHIQAAALPLSHPFRRATANDPELLDLAWVGGEDYELLFTVPPDQEALLRTPEFIRLGPLSRIGTIEPPGTGLKIVGRAPAKTGAQGYSHF